MKNTIVNKRIFAAQYFYQRVFMFENEPMEEYTPYILNGTTIEQITDEKSFLLLKTLSSITPEDSLAAVDFVVGDLFKKMGCEFKVVNEFGVNDVVVFNNGRYWNTFRIKEMSLNRASSEYLKAKGYAIPHLNLSVEDLIEYGWVKLQTI